MSLSINHNGKVRTAISIAVKYKGLLRTVSVAKVKMNGEIRTIFELIYGFIQTSDLQILLTNDNFLIKCKDL